VRGLFGKGKPGRAGKHASGRPCRGRANKREKVGDTKAQSVQRVGHFIGQKTEKRAGFLWNVGGQKEKEKWEATLEVKGRTRRRGERTGFIRFEPGQTAVRTRKKVLLVKESI